MVDRRRAKGEGTVRERSDGLWEAREPPEVVPFGESPRSFYGKSKAEAVRKLREAMRIASRASLPMSTGSPSAGISRTGSRDRCENRSRRRHATTTPGSAAST
jgi:hypothetical protein